MDSLDIKKALESIDINPDEIEDKKLANAFKILFQIVAIQYEEIQTLKKENQELKDEINRLKGEQGRPKFPSSKGKGSKDISSEKERRDKRPKAKRKFKAKKQNIKIDTELDCKVDRKILPEDAEFKGNQYSILQDIIIKSNNIRLIKETFYSSLERKSYIAPSPKGFEGDYGPGVISLIHILKYSANMSEAKIKEFLNNFGIMISKGTISRILTRKNELFHEEKEEIFDAGIRSTNYTQIDDTITTCNGEKYFTQIFCNPYFTTYFSTLNKDRLSLLRILQGAEKLEFTFNEEAFSILEEFKVSNKIKVKLREYFYGKTLNEDNIELVWEKVIPANVSGKITQRKIMGATAIAAYHEQDRGRKISVLLSDDAPQFRMLTEEHALCWIHDGRNYKKLNPVVGFHKDELEVFSKEYWKYYDKLSDYKKNPGEEKAKSLSNEFDELVSKEANYPALNDRIKTTKKNKSKLLQVLKYPELPLHNNASELGARAVVRKRDVSLHTMSKEGREANDTFLSIVETAKKLGVNIYDYIYDRISQSFTMPSLSELILAKSSMGYP